MENGSVFSEVWYELRKLWPSIFGMILAFVGTLMIKFLLGTDLNLWLEITLWSVGASAIIAGAYLWVYGFNR